MEIGNTFWKDHKQMRYAYKGNPNAERNRKQKLVYHARINRKIDKLRKKEGKKYYRKIYGDT